MESSFWIMHTKVYATCHIYWEICKILIFKKWSSCSKKKKNSSRVWHASSFDGYSSEFSGFIFKWDKELL